ncbi:MAG: helix-turn-helix transcriptional regulator [Gemmatimonadetes bacterium]|nr:helix-turn-helix transcriptional regulator [Gemmatimonadota bacterium]
MSKDVLGEFEHQVMLAILRLGRESYSVPLVLELEETTERDVAPAAVYIALRRMEAKGLLTSRMTRANADEGGRERRYFALTREGMVRLRDSRRTFVRLWEGVAATLDQV